MWRNDRVWPWLLLKHFLLHLKPLPRDGNGAGNSPKPPPSPVSFGTGAAGLKPTLQRTFFLGGGPGWESPSLLLSLPQHPEAAQRYPDRSAAGESVGLSCLWKVMFVCSRFLCIFFFPFCHVKAANSAYSSVTRVLHPSCAALAHL